MRASFKSPLTLLIFGVNLALAGAVVVRLWQGTETNRLLAVPALSTRVPILLREASVERTTKMVLVQDRVLFHASRQFFVPPPPSAFAALPKPNYRLLGTVLAAGRPTVALLQATGSTTTKRVKPGEDLDGWTVRAVEQGRVILIHETEQFEIGAPAGVHGGLIVLPINRIARVDNLGGVRFLGGGASLSSTRPALSGDARARLYRPPPSH